jgi:hypothetical protein
MHAINSQERVIEPHAFKNNPWVCTTKIRQFVFVHPPCDAQNLGLILWRQHSNGLPPLRIQIFSHLIC